MFSFIILLGIIILTLYVALMYDNEAVVLLSYMEVAFFLVSIITLVYRMRTMKVKLDIPVGISEAGKEHLVKIVINNKSFFSVLRTKVFVVVEDSIRNIKKKYWMELPEVLSGKNEFVKNIIFPGTGNYVITLKKLRIYDWTGLLNFDLNSKCSERVQVMPEIHDIPVKLTLAIKNFYGEADEYDDKIPGDDKSELFQVREYRKGDRLQNVHWKLTAKQDDIMVKEHSHPKACPVIFILDFKEKKKQKSDRYMIAYMEAAVSISFSMMDAGCPHYVAWYDADEQDVCRIRVEDEETFFYFIGMIMRVNFQQAKESVKDLYMEKYKRERYVWALSLDEDLLLKKGDDILAQFSEEKLEESLSQVEILL